MGMQGNNTPRVLFFGMQSSFSTPSLAALLAQGIEVCAVVLPAPEGKLTIPLAQRLPVARQRMMLAMAGKPDILTLAQQHNLPIWEVARLGHPQTIATLAAYRPDFICVACFSQRIPRAILDLPRLGSLNVHPSLLPANRGPFPLFWTLRLGERQAGITIHLLEETLDSGAILAQTAFDLEDGLSYEEIEMQCAVRGGNMLACCVWELPAGLIHATPQDEAASSYYPAPQEQDFLIPVAEWGARHVYNFIRGLRNWGHSLTLLTEKGDFPVVDGISYSQSSLSNNRSSVQLLENNDLIVTCRDGQVHAKQP